MCGDGPAAFTQREAFLLAALALPVAALVLADLVENTVGLTRLSSVGALLALPVLAGSVLVLRWLLPSLGAAVQHPGRRAVVVAVLLALALLAMGWFSDTCHPAPPLPDPPATWRLGCAAHSAKTGLLPVVLVLQLLALLAWLFGFFLRDAAARDVHLIDPHFVSRRDARARLRAALTMNLSSAMLGILVVLFGFVTPNALRQEMAVAPATSPTAAVDSSFSIVGAAILKIQPDEIVSAGQVFTFSAEVKTDRRAKTSEVQRRLRVLVDGTEALTVSLVDAGPTQ